MGDKIAACAVVAGAALALCMDSLGWFALAVVALALGITLWILSLGE